MKVHHVLVAAAVLCTVSAASAGQRWDLLKTDTETHPHQAVACQRATNFAETTLVAQCRSVKGRLTIVEGDGCHCAPNADEFTCVATAQGFCER